MRDESQCDVAIVGGGPSGLGAAIALRAAGVARVVVIEREAQAGGVPRHCGHPAFGLREFGRLMSGPRYARALVARAQAAGVDIRTGHTVTGIAPGGSLTVTNHAGTQTIGARRVVLATGAREASRAARMIGGDRPPGVINTGALQAHVYLEGTRPFRRPVIVGTELVSLSAVWACLAHGMRPRAVIEAGNRAVARHPLGLFPNLCGIPVHYGATLSQIRGLQRVESVVVARGDGPALEIECDGVLLTGRFLPEASLARAGHLAIDSGTGGPAVDQNHRCSDPAYFATGNVLRAIETAGWCFREGQALGRRLAEELRALARPIETLAIRVEPPFAFSVPQRFAPADGLTGPALQLRLAAPTRGDLVVSSGGDVLYHRPIASRPERRILVPLEALAKAQAPITIGIS